MARGVLDKPWPFFLGAGLLLLAAIASQFEVGAPTLSYGNLDDFAELRNQDDVNVIFILIDTLRADHLGMYGYERDTSPNLDLMAKGGIVFKHAISQSSWTKSSMASLWTATRPANSGIVHYDHVIPSEATLPAEIFRDAGYRTAAVYRNGWVAPNFGFGQGFETYIKPVIGAERRRVARKNPSGKLMGTDEDLLNSAIEFLEIYGHERFFMYLHMMDIHQYVYDDKATQFGTSYFDVYDQSINWTDRVIANLVDTLGEMGLRSKTLIVIAADHGEAFNEHGREGHARDLYREVIWTPIILIPPFYMEGGIEVDALVSNLDLWPTVLDIIGLPPIPNADGVSFRSSILAAGGTTEGMDEPPRPAYSQINIGWGKKNFATDPVVSVTHGDHQLIMHAERPEDVVELYDISADPQQKRNIYATDGQKAAELHQLAEDYFTKAKSPWDVEPPRKEISELMRGQLHALGYVID